jgi:hypothetical protein
MIAEDASVRSMTVRHEKAVGTDDGLFTILGPEMYGGEFADHGAVSNLDVRNGTFLILQVLRLHANKGIRKYLTVLTDCGVTIHDGALTNGGSGAELHVSPNCRVRSNLDAITKLGVLIHHRGGMYF